MLYVDISWKTEQHQILVVLADPIELQVTFGVAKEELEVAGTFPETRASARPARPVGRLVGTGSQCFEMCFT